MKTLRFFISSPGDVAEERAIAGRVIERLQSEYVGRVFLESVLWEHEPLVATSTFQHQIVKPSATDVVVAILWSRLGTKLPEEFRREDGSRYESGTEFEFEEAMQGFRRNGKPHLLVYRKTAPPSVRLDDEKDLMERLAQKKKLDVFVDKWFHDKAEGTLIAAFHPFLSPSDFEILVENHLRRLIERELPRNVAATSEARAVWRKGSPFRGLEAFEFEHAPVFFGRTRAVSDVLQALREQAAAGRSFVLILGMSGGGKSSVVRAGVLPMLTRPGVIEGVGLWRRAVFRPTDVRGDLFAGLSKALLREHALPSLDADGKGPEELAQILRESPQAATSLIRNALQREEQQDGKPNARLALVIDQMEEIYTQEETYTQKEAGSQEQNPSGNLQSFVDLIDALARTGRVWVICTLRSDFYPRLANYPKLGALKEGAGQYDLMPPTASEIGQMIRLPANAAGLHFEEDPATSERLDDMLRDAAAGHREILPLLQFTLEELYRRRTEHGQLTLASYRELGGVEGSLAKRAETVFKQLPDDVQAELPRVLNELVSIGHDAQASIGRKRAPWSDLSSGKSRLLVDAFVDNRLFVTELADDGSAVVTVAHEALLWHWPRVTDWVAQNRESLRIRARIAVAAQRWDAEKRPHDLLLPAGKPLIEAEMLLEYGIELHQDEAQYIQASIARARRLQRLKAGMVATVAILGVVAAGFAFIANQQQRLARVEAETASQTTNFMLRLFEVSDPSEARGNTITAREIMDRGAERIQKELAAQPRIQATLMETMGTVYTSLGLYDQAVLLLESALEKRKSLFGDKHLEVAQSMDRLGWVLMLKAEYGRALSMQRDALALRREMLGDEHAETARSVYNVADLHGRMGEFAEAEPLFREALAVRRTLAGAQSPEVAQSTEGLALNLFDQGKFEEAVTLMREAVAMQRKLHDGPHPQLADALNNLGWVLGDMGQYQEAEQLYREALEMQRVLVGDTHPFIAIGLNNVAFVLQQQGKYEAAEALYFDALTMQHKLLGEDHPDVALALNNLAYVAHDKGDLKTAVSMSRDSLEMYRRLLGEEHPLVAQGMNSLAMWLIEDGDLASAEPLVRQAVDMRRKLLGPDHSDVATSMTLLAGLLVDTGRYEEALALGKGAKAICTKALAPGHWRTASAEAVEGAAMAGLGRFDEAEKLLLAGYGVLHEEKGAAHVYVANSSRWLAKLYLSMGQPAKAAQYRVSQHG